MLALRELLALPPGRDAHAVFGSPDDLKLRSSMTLFAAASPAPEVFERVLARYYGGVPDDRGGTVKAKLVIGGQPQGEAVFATMTATMA